MTEHWWEDDDELLALVTAALREEQVTPARLVDGGKAAFTWQTIDAELASLIYDTLTDPVAAGTRAERATVREVTFASRALTIHLQLSGTAIRGQLVPPQSGRLEVQHRTRAAQQVDIDEHGWFSVPSIPEPIFRLSVDLGPGPTVYTDWLQL